MQPRTRNSAWLILALLTLCALALRVLLLDAQSLWYDEGVTAEVARRGIAELTRWTADDIQPPLYSYVVALWGRLGGWSEWSLRWPSVWFGTLSVPLLAAVTIALTRRRAAGLLTATFATVHPLLVYYSQEARMYTMLTALGLTVAYLVIHSERAITRPRLHWTAYVLVATAAAYTHYFAFFLLLALAAAYLIDQWVILPRQHTEPLEPDHDEDLPPPAARRPVLGFIAANLGVAVLYLPWFATLLRRLTVDASYWDGELKIDEALRHIAISFTSGETVLESQATQFLIPYGLLTLACVIALLRRHREQPRVLIYTGLWLALPIATVLVLASLTPKFNPRYVMIALPGLLLLWGAGLAALVRLRGWDIASIIRTPFVRIPSLLALLVIAILHVGFLYADRNWFTDPSFTKAEWRELSRYLRERVARDPIDETPQDLIVLVSGHAWPIWNYYAPDLPVLRLPDIEILDVNAVLDFTTTASPLQAALARHERAWLIEWQDNVVDPMGIVPLQLAAAGREEAVKEAFWQVGLRHFTDLQSDNILQLADADLAPDANVGNQIHLLDHRVTSNGDLILFWQAHPDHTAPMPDLYLAGETYTAEGLTYHRIADRRLVSYEFPTFRWSDDQINVGVLSAAEWAGDGALPATYRVRLAVYDIDGDLAGLDVFADDGRPLGKTITLDLNLPIATPGQDTLDRRTYVPILPGLHLELNLDATQAEPGQAFAVSFTWYVSVPQSETADLDIRWRDPSSGELVGRQIIRLGRAFPLDRWPERQALRDIIELRPPLNLPPDDTWLEIGLTHPDSAFVRIPFRVLGSSRMFIPPPYQTPVDLVLSDQLHLRGIIEPRQTTVGAGSQVVFTLVWQAIGQPIGDYTTAVQWLGADGRPAAQADLLLPGGSSNWIDGQVELQTVIMNAPAEPGAYRLIVAAYDAAEPGLPRLFTPDGHDLVDLGIVTVEP